MSELIKVQSNDRMEPVISGRELHEFLEVGTRYNDWFVRMTEYGFSENNDYQAIAQKRVTAQGNQTEFTDHALRLDMAKEISMIQRNEKGKQARQYFIAIEKEFNSPEKVMARALRIADETINTLKLETKIKDQQIAELSPKATYYDLVLQSKELITITAIAQDYGLTAQKLNQILEEEGVQYKQSGMWLLKGRYKDSGYTFSKTNPYSDNGEIKTKLHTYWTQAGRLFIYDLLKQMGILPIIERD